MAHVDGPRDRQRNQIEHAAPVPCRVVPFPEKRMAHVFGPHPGPVLGTPPLRVAIATRFDEFEEGRVRHVVPLEAECGDGGGQGWLLVVPAEHVIGAVAAKRGLASRDLDPFCAWHSAVDHYRVPAGRRFCSNGSRCHI